MKIRALVVDDEPIARERIRRMLRGEADIEIVDECLSGREAVALIERHAPELVFLDIQMPEMNGFDVLKAISPRHLPVIIFVTAYDRYAIRAFEVHALDYLLKPFDEERFQAALNRAREQIETLQQGKRLLSVLSDLKPEKHYSERLMLKSSGRVYFIKTEDIGWIEAAGNYVKIHVAGTSHLLRETMNKIEAKLDPDKFIRIHRSTIVNLDQVRELHPLFNNDYIVVLYNGAELTLSRNYYERLQRVSERL